MVQNESQELRIGYGVNLMEWNPLRATLNSVALGCLAGRYNRRRNQPSLALLKALVKLGITLVRDSSERVDGVGEQIFSDTVDGSADLGPRIEGAGGLGQTLGEGCQSLMESIQVGGDVLEGFLDVGESWSLSLSGSLGWARGGIGDRLLISRHWVYSLCRSRLGGHLHCAHRAVYVNWTRHRKKRGCGFGSY